MKFKALQDNLRKTLWARIAKGELTGLCLAEQTGFKQAHISNFLNRKRGLRLEGGINAARAVIMNMHVLSVYKFQKSFLHKLRAELEGDREHWERFLVIKAD